MPQITFRENKTLKLSCVLSRKAPSQELFSQDKQIAILQGYVKSKGLETVGPLILYSSGIKGMDAENKPILDSYVMVQLKTSSHKPEITYKFEKEIRIERCLFARINDKSENLQFATMKLQLFAYENDIELTGETYMVLIKQEENNLLADVFMPIKSKEDSEDN